MTAKPSIDPARMLHDQLASASPDLLRSLLATFPGTLMSAEADAICGAPYGMPSPDRVNVRNGYRHQDFDTRVGTLDVAIPGSARAAISRTGCWSAAAAPRPTKRITRYCETPTSQGLTIDKKDERRSRG